MTKRYYEIKESECKAHEDLQINHALIEKEEADKMKESYEAYIKKDSDSIFTKEQLLKVAAILRKAYDDCEEVIHNGASNEWVYESLEEEIGCSHSSFITNLAHLVGLTSEKEL